ncbi:MAG: sugar ABC transporter permease [Pleurocapsa minor GSE-CHR-MK-17-07R]|jgi:trehalose/maltose transport system permease protein|nr:sugar ABC transporter permease [Pleurocapsa minor GSE-CHR-MK 17-07R]
MSVNSQSRPADQGLNALGIPLVAALFVIAGAAAFALFASNITATLSAALPDDPGGQTLLNFLYTYGIIVPLLLVGIGAYMLLLGVRLFRADHRSATWARQILLWLAIASVVFIFQGLTSAPVLGPAPTMDERMRTVLPLAAVLVVAGAAWYWLGKNEHLYTGQETLEQASSRSAWNLLLPTIVILIIVAMRPLEKTFIASLTDDTFAAGADETVNFVGLENYSRLLGFRFDSLPCVRDEASGACAVDASGAIQFARPRDVLDESYADLRFREVSGVNIGENRLIFSGRDRDFWDSVTNTITFSIVSVVLELILGLFIALVINSKFRGRGLLRTAMLIPWAIPTVVSARLWDLMLRDSSSGIINAFLLSTGIVDAPQAWLANQSLQIPAMIAIDVWKTTPFMALILLAGLQVISAEIYEAANVDGANGIRQFFSITLPLLRPAITIALVFRTLDAVRVFDLFQVLLGRGRLSMATYNYDTLINAQDLGYASAIGVVIFALILVFTILYVRILGVKAE